MVETTPTSALVGLRLAIGLGSWLTPRVAGRLFGLDAAANPQLPYLARLFGARDVALAGGVLLSSQTEARSLWLRIGVACDAADSVAGVAAGTRGELGPLSAALVTGVALGAGALGLSALRAEEAAQAPTARVAAPPS